MTRAVCFHLAFPVTDLAATRAFYGGVLGCSEGRSAPEWVDFDFFGHQISAHTTGTIMRTEKTGQVDGVAVPMPHFGALLGWALPLNRWVHLARSAEARAREPPRRQRAPEAASSRASAMARPPV